MSDVDDTVQRVYAQVRSTRDNLREGGTDERHVAEFHGHLDRLDALGFDVAEFRVPDSYLVQDPTRPSSNQRIVRTDLFGQRLDALLIYFTPRPEPKPPMGFTGPRKPRTRAGNGADRRDRPSADRRPPPDQRRQAARGQDGVRAHGEEGRGLVGRQVLPHGHGEHRQEVADNPL